MSHRDHTGALRSRKVEGSSSWHVTVHSSELPMGIEEILPPPNIGHVIPTMILGRNVDSAFATEYLGLIGPGTSRMRDEVKLHATAVDMPIDI